MTLIAALTKAKQYDIIERCITETTDTNEQWIMLNVRLLDNGEKFAKV